MAMDIKRKTGIAIAIFLFVISMLIGWTLSPHLISLYFDNQKTYSITESKLKLHTDSLSKPEKDSILLGQSIVLKGYVDEYFIIHTSPNTGMQMIPVIDRINCIPWKNGYYKVVGAYNLVTSTDNFNNQVTVPKLEGDRIIELPNEISNKELKFFALWIVGGCDK
jgi:hypothetical protein